MPLSEEELRMLEQMERELAAEDPKFVATLQGRSMRRSARMRTILAGVAFLVGVALMMGGAMARMTWLGIVGFLVMLGAATVGLAAWRGQHPTAEPTESEETFGLDDSRSGFRVIEGGKPQKARRPRKPKASGSFMDRMEQRWQQRRGDQGF